MNIAVEARKIYFPCISPSRWGSACKQLRLIRLRRAGRQPQRIGFRRRVYYHR